MSTKTSAQQSLHRRLIDAVEASIDGLAIHDADGRFTYCNRAHAATYGFAGPDELVGQHWHILYEPAEVARLEREVLPAFRQHGFWRGEAVGRRRDGTLFEQEISLTRGAEGTFVCVVRDRSQRKQIEADLRELLHFNEQVIRHSGDGVVVYDEVGHIVVWNPMMEQLTGLHSTLVWGRKFTDVVAHLREPVVVDWWRRALAGEHVRTPDTRIHLPETGKTAWVRSTFCPNRNADGEIVGVIELVRDVSKLRNDRLALQFRIDLEQVIIRISSKLVSIAPAKLDEAIEEALAEVGEFLKVDHSYLFHFEDNQRFVTNVYEWCAPGIRREKESLQRVPVESIPWLARQLLEDRVVQISRVADLGSEARQERDWLERRSVRSLAVVPLRLGNEIRAFIGVDSCTAERTWSGDEISLLRVVGETFVGAMARRQAEEGLRASERRLLHSQKMEAVGRLAGGVAHDFNNLLTAITGYCELMSAHLAEESPARSHAAQIRRAASRASALTQQLLAFSRRQMLAPRAIRLTDVVEEMESMLGRLIGEHIQLRTILEGDCWVLSDPAQIEQVVVNLAVNARDAMPAGGTLTLEVREVELDETEARRLHLREPGPYVELKVEDNGEGMSEETLAHVFEPFFTTKAQGQGTGLGLSTVYGIVDQSGGGIQVTSTPGEGTRFRIVIPRHEKPQPVVEAPPPPPLLPAGVDATVLVVEDEEPVRQLIRLILEERGYKVTTAVNGKDALAQLRSPGGAAPQLIITDLVMPVMSGRELADEAARAVPQTRVLFMSGYASESLPSLAQPGGDVAFLAKPFAPEELVRKVAEVLETAVPRS